MKQKKLTLNKETFQALNSQEANGVLGAGSGSGVTKYMSCNTIVNISCHSCVGSGCLPSAYC